MLRSIKLLQHLRTKPWNAFLIAAGIFALAFILYQQYDHLLGRTQTGYTYWNLLARSFLDGKLYLEDPPTLHDLTLYEGHWYVPQPPLPALVMLPFALLARDRLVDPILFSVLFSALNCVLVFLILDQMRMRAWTSLPRSGLLWLVVLFGLGSPHLYVGMDGRVWFVSQVLTVTFLSLAVLGALKTWSPWLIGLCLGAAVAARPNVFVLWPFLLAIQLQVKKDSGSRTGFWQVSGWIIASALPVIASAAGLLYYNYLRFHDLFDFGYATISGWERIVQDVQTYGMFSPHFIPRNLSLMFFGLPFQPAYPYVTIPVEGLSIFLTTPALLYLFRRYEKKVWIIGGWSAFLLSVGLLSMYSNTGAYQFGYRYVLDFILPVLMLIASTLRKVPKLLIALIILSVLINVAGAWWFIGYNDL